MVIYNKEKLKQYKGYINWEAWERIVKETKEKIAQDLATMKKHKIPKRQLHPCYLYNSDGNLEQEFTNVTDLANFLDTSNNTVYRYLRHQDIYNGYLVSNDKLEKETAQQLYITKLTQGLVRDTQNTRRGKPCYCYNSDGKLVGAFDSIFNFKFYGGGYYFKEDCIQKGRLVSKYYYSEETAKKIFEKLNAKRRRRH